MIVGTGVARVGAPHEKWVSKQLVHRLPLAKGYPMLEYSSSELFTRFTEGGRTVVVLSGGAGTPGELCLSGMAGATLLHDSLAGTLHEKGDRWTWSYSHTADRLLVFDVGGKKLVLLITTTAEAGRLWRLTDPSGKTWLLSDARFASKVGSGPSFDAEWDGGGDGTVLVLGPRAPKELVLGGSSLVGKRVPSAGAWIGKVAVSPVYPPAPALGGGMAVSEPEADDSGWSATDSGPAKLEALGIYKGHAWYRTDFEATSLPGTRVYFRAGKAAGIISGWLNGKYFGTAFPKGTGLEMSIPRKHFKLGKNVLAFRVQIWGHSSFEIPTVPGVLDFPALQVAFPRGLWDGASLASMFDMWKVSLSLPWRYRAGLHGERHHWAGAVDPAGAVEAKLPLSLSSGATVWYRTTLAGPTLPPKTLRAPLVLALEGEGLIATVFVNGVLIGRWISDNETLASDSYGNGRRDQWVPEEISYDEIYVPRSLLHGGTNVVALALESLVKGPYARRGAVSSKLRSLSLRYSADGFDKTKDGGHLRSVSLPLTVHE